MKRTTTLFCLFDSFPILQHLFPLFRCWKLSWLSRKNCCLYTFLPFVRDFPLPIQPFLLQLFSLSFTVSFRRSLHSSTPIIAQTIMCWFLVKKKWIKKNKREKQNKIRIEKWLNLFNAFASLCRRRHRRCCTCCCCYSFVLCISVLIWFLVAKRKNYVCAFNPKYWPKTHNSTPYNFIFIPLSLKCRTHRSNILFFFIFRESFDYILDGDASARSLSLSFYIYIFSVWILVSVFVRCWLTVNTFMRNFVSFHCNEIPYAFMR